MHAGHDETMVFAVESSSFSDLTCKCDDTSQSPFSRPLQERWNKAYLIVCAAHWSTVPFRTTQIHQLFPQIIIRFLRLAVVDARQLLAEEALGAAMVPDGASPSLVYWSVEFVGCR